MYDYPEDVKTATLGELMEYYDEYPQFFYTDKSEAIYREIIPILGDFVEDFDIDAIADRVLIGVGEGVHYRIIRDPDIDEDELWDIIEANDRSLKKE